MPVSLASTEVPVLTSTAFDPRSPEQARRLTAMYRDYLHEELERTGHAAPGLPVAGFLNTRIVWLDSDMIGFCSLDFTRYAAELVYVEPQYRRQGIAHAVLARLKTTCPEPMRAKAPLTPLGQALVDSVGIGVTGPAETEDEEAARLLDDLHRVLAEECRHRRGNPARPCRRCYRRALAMAAESVVGTYVAVACLPQLLTAA